MDSITSLGVKRYWWIGVAAPNGVATTSFPSPNVCLLWDAIGTWTPSERATLLEALLASGCRYVVCGGQRCEEWHDEADELLALRGAAAKENDPLVITTWHADEPIDEVAEFFVLHAHVLNTTIADHIVVQVGLDWDIQCRLMDWVRGWVEHPYGEDAAPAG